jgi:hypothetical protein
VLQEEQVVELVKQVKHKISQASQVLFEVLPKKDPVHDITHKFDYKNFPELQDVQVVEFV